jgi:hypothetical protein
VAGSMAPGSDIIIPTIYSLSSNNVLEGTAKMVTIYGDNFVTTVDGVTRSSVVMIVGGGSDLEIEPNTITSNQIIVTIPPLNKGFYGIHIHKNGSAESNTRPLISAPAMIINSARKIDPSTVTIVGSGFGAYDAVYKDFVNVTIHAGSTLRPLQITNWTDTSITVVSSDASIGDTATVSSVYGINSSQVTS